MVQKKYTCLKFFSSRHLISLTESYLKAQGLPCLLTLSSPENEFNFHIISVPFHNDLEKITGKTFKICNFSVPDRQNSLVIWFFPGDIVSTALGSLKLLYLSLSQSQLDPLSVNLKHVKKPSRSCCVPQQLSSQQLLCQIL